MRAVAGVLLAVSMGCDQSSIREPKPEQPAPASALTSASKPAPASALMSRPTEHASEECAPTEEQVRVEELNRHQYPPTYVVRGPHGPEKMVFLHGMCGQGLGYAQAFPDAAAKRGLLIAPQGDVLCGKGAGSSWSGDFKMLNARIVDAFQQLGVSEPIEDVVLIGYSQGASRAWVLAQKYPKRYSRLVLIGGPEVPSTRGLTHLRSVVTMSGERDRQDLMQASSRAFRNAGVPTTFLMIPEAVHGAMGPHPEKTMGEALDWLFEHDR